MKPARMNAAAHWKCVLTMSETRGKGGRGIKIINGGPYEMPELQQLFGDVTLEELAGCWVGCIVDSFLEYVPKVSTLALTLGIVAERLHGVRFQNPVFFEGKNLMEAQPKNEAGFVVSSDAPPQPKAGQRNDPLALAIRGLMPGQHIRIAEGRITRAGLSAKLNGIKKSTGREDLRSYIAFNGDLVVTADKSDATPTPQSVPPSGRAQRRESANA